jgi:LmbE family N-acetylglucosaminyl deacetylase
LKRTFFLIVVASLVQHAATAQGDFPETGRQAIWQRATDLANDINVLSIAIRPGDEDLETLAYLRLARGARILSAYVTNGEATESDRADDLPPQIAAQLRDEATQALRYLDGEAYFLTLPDFGAARDTASVRRLWPIDTLQKKLRALISQFRPDLIVLAHDYAMGSTSPSQRVIADAVVAASQAVRREWAVNYIVARTTRKAAMVPVHSMHPLWKKSYRAIGREAQAHYRTLSIQLQRRLVEESPSYVTIRPFSRSPRRIDAGLPVATPAALQATGRKVRTLCSLLLNQKTDEMLARVRVTAKKNIAEILERVERRLAQPLALTPVERKRLLKWKGSLEDLRNAVLGVQAHWTISDSIVTDRQVIYLTVDSLRGASTDGTTEIFFANAQQGWIINEDLHRRLPFNVGEEFRLLSPQKLEYNYPRVQYGLYRPTHDEVFTFFIIHKAKSPEENFVYRGHVPLKYAPRFITEVIPPIVRAVQGEQVMIRLMNNSRDGVQDTVAVVDSLATASRSAFSLIGKGSTHEDTLTLSWRTSPFPSEFVSSVRIGEVQVSQFLVRNFSVEVNAQKKVAFVSPWHRSSLADALRRIGVRSKAISAAEFSDTSCHGINVLVLDRRLLTLQPEFASHEPALHRFLESGGHLVVLSQDADAWNVTWLGRMLRLEKSSKIASDCPVALDTTHPLLSTPNKVSALDFDNWLFSLGRNTIRAASDAAVEYPVTATCTDTPLIASMQSGKGKITYVDLTLAPQWMSVSPGSLRLLANLVAN